MGAPRLLQDFLAKDPLAQDCSILSTFVFCREGAPISKLLMTSYGTTSNVAAFGNMNGGSYPSIELTNNTGYCV
jgi:hypothetical protein